MSTGIEWTDETWNPTIGCTVVSEGCRNCYAAKEAIRLAGRFDYYAGLSEMRGDRHRRRAVFTGKVRLMEERLDQPLRWRKPRMIFVNSMSDLFHPDVPFEYIDRVFAAMVVAHWHTYQVLTKRPERAAEYMASRARAFESEPGFENPVQLAIERIINERPTREDAGLWGWPPPNVWLGTSVEDQATANERIPHLLKTPAAVRFLSCEPLLGPVNLRSVDAEMAGHDDMYFIDALTGQQTDMGRPYYDAPGIIHWVIVGGESGPNARPMEPAWARSIRDACTASGVAFFFKQWGEHAPLRVDNYEYMRRTGKKKAGRVLDGRTWDEMPAEARA